VSFDLGFSSSQASEKKIASQKRTKDLRRF